MRTRETIETEIKQYAKTGRSHETNQLLGLIGELLLDIRDILMEEKKLRK